MIIAVIGIIWMLAPSIPWLRRLPGDSHDEKQRVRLWKDSKEEMPLNSTSPLWMKIRMVGGDGKPAKDVPLKDGYFEMQMPKAFFEENPKSLTLKWIDFYRN